MAEFSFTCTKCGSQECVFEELRGSSGGITAYLDLDTRIITLVVCRKCRFVEIYSTYLADFLTTHNLKEREWSGEDSVWIEPELDPGVEPEQM